MVELRLKWWVWIWWAWKCHLKNKKCWNFQALHATVDCMVWDTLPPVTEAAPCQDHSIVKCPFWHRGSVSNTASVVIWSRAARRFWHIWKREIEDEFVFNIGCFKKQKLKIPTSSLQILAFSLKLSHLNDFFFPLTTDWFRFLHAEVSSKIAHMGLSWQSSG